MNDRYRLSSSSSSLLLLLLLHFAHISTVSKIWQGLYKNKYVVVTPWNSNCANKILAINFSMSWFNKHFTCIFNKCPLRIRFFLFFLCSFFRSFPFDGLFAFLSCKIHSTAFNLLSLYNEINWEFCQLQVQVTILCTVQLQENEMKSNQDNNANGIEI